MVTILSSIEKKANHLSHLKVEIGNHTKYLRKQALWLGCSIEKVGDSGEEISKRLMHNSYGTAEAHYRIKSIIRETYFTVKYKVYNY